jgi:hypothetical protein
MVTVLDLDPADLAYATDAERAELDRLDDFLAARAELEADWELWLAALFPGYCSAPFGPHHRDFWRWLWSIRAGVRPSPFVAVWPRSGAKSSSAELGIVALGARRIRRYGLLVSETQDQADDHVQNVAAMLESEALAEWYPDMADRMVGKFGHSKGWRRNRLRTRGGFTLDAVGLDTAARGIKIEDARPDFAAIDDVDGEHDSAKTTDRKVGTLTRKLLPAGSSDLAVLAIQNLVAPDSIFARLVDGRADFLADRVVSGPIPALVDMAVEERGGRHVIVAGTPSWAGQDLAACQGDIDDFGLTAFRQECQHEVDDPPGGMFSHLDFRHCSAEEVPALRKSVVWVDPAVTDGDDSDSMGIQADGLADDGTIYRLWSWEQRTTPLDALKRAILKAVELKADHVGVETDQGGDTWKSVYREAIRELEATGQLPDDYRPRFRSEKAGAGHGPKVHRAGLMLATYERGGFVHVLGTHAVLERALRRFPKTKPFDVVDAAYWSSWSLAGHGRRRLGNPGVAA